MKSESMEYDHSEDSTSSKCHNSANLTEEKRMDSTRAARKYEEDHSGIDTDTAVGIVPIALHVVVAVVKMMES